MIDDATIREYLLGRLDADLELVDCIDEQMLTNAEFSTSVDIVEDEIMEEYLEGSLNADDTQAVERHFLRPPERQRKLRNARLLNLHLANALSESEGAQQSEPLRRSPHPWTKMGNLPGFRAFAEIAAAALFTVSIVNLMHQRRELSAAVERANQRPTETLAQATAANQNSHASLQIIEPATGVLNLLEPGLTRGDGHLPAVELGAAPGALHIEVAIPADRAGKLQPIAGKYQIHLDHAGQTLWSRDGVDAIVVSGGAIVKLDLPADVLPIGTCELVLKQPGKADLSYSFVVSALR